MAITNLDSLKTAILDWTIRDDLPLDNIISVAEPRIWDDLRLRVMGAREVHTATVSEKVIETPQRFIDMRRLSVLQGNGRVELTYTGPDEMPSINGTGLPNRFTIHSNQIELDAYLQPGQQLEMLFFRSPWPLGIPIPEEMPADEIPKYSTNGATVDTNPILATRPNIYLWASLIECDGFDGSDASAWAARYKEAVDKANETSTASQSSGSRRATTSSRSVA